ncbi:MAG: hypothetical protein K0M50_04115 [Prolixibacteraceae bacterium]|nr:hypothetical protein [Prolixibacteraceae bacterium]
MENSFTKEDIENFTSTIDNFFELKSTEQLDCFVYFLTVEKQLPTTQATAIRNCFLYLDISPYSNISQYLNQNLKGKGKQPPKFLRIKDGYQLHRALKNSIETLIDKKPLKTQVNKDLRQLLTFIQNPDENEFLKEAIDCYEISAYRAAIVMVWNLTVDHLFTYILKHKLNEFNATLVLNNDKRIKISAVNDRDDFNEIPENKFIEFCRISKIISNDVRKILDTKLGIRNTYAHPSNLKISESKAIEFIEDLINNVIFKYTL